MTTVYFVRHAEVEYDPNVEDYLRPLSLNGLLQTNKINKLFEHKQVDCIFSSPYLRAIQTIKGIADKREIDIIKFESLRERKVSNGHIEDFNEFAYKQWMNHDFKLTNGESLNETKSRAIEVLEEILLTNNSKTILIGIHGTILSVILNHYDSNFGYEKWKKMKMPEVYELKFENQLCQSIEIMDI